MGSAVAALYELWVQMWVEPGQYVGRLWALRGPGSSVRNGPSIHGRAQTFASKRGGGHRQLTVAKAEGINCRDVQSRFLRLFGIMYIGSQARPHNLTRRLNSVPLIFKQVIFNNNFRITHRLYTIIRQPRLFGSCPFTFSSFRNNARNVNSMNVRYLISFIVFLFR